MGSSTMQVGSYFGEAQGTDTGRITVYDNDALYGDTYIAWAQTWEPTVEDDWIFVGWQIGLSDPAGSVFGDDALPTDLSLDDFDNATFHFGLLATPDPDWEWPPPETLIEGDVTGIYFVPEPAAGFMLLTGLLVAEGAQLATRTLRRRGFGGAIHSLSSSRTWWT